MLSLINKKIKNVELLYRGTRDGDLAKNFHEKCDNKGPTLTLCKEKSENIIFGGYTEAEWDSQERHPKYDENVLFSLLLIIKNLYPKTIKILLDVIKILDLYLDLVEI